MRRPHASLALLLAALVGCPAPAPPPPPGPPTPPPVAPAVPPPVVPAPPVAPVVVVDVDLPPFPFSRAECTVPVFYVFDRRSDRPRPGGTARAVLGLTPHTLEVLGPQPAPDLRVRSVREAVLDLERTIQAVDSNGRTRLRLVREWIRNRGAAYIGLQLEPRAIAGDGTAWLRGKATEEAH